MVQVSVKRKDDELVHGHKYISKKWKNGKWQYTYADGTNAGQKIKAAAELYKNSPEAVAKNKASQQRAARNEAIKKEEKKLKRNLPLQKAKKQINKGKKYLDKLFK